MLNAVYKSTKFSTLKDHEPVCENLRKRYWLMQRIHGFECLEKMMESMPSIDKNDNFILNLLDNEIALLQERLETL